mmetsp:Transcript_10307/g.18094  ORF Transcript_10307/g.18094 Transcript_10307/m.18094 type:complete len:935 (-) Transcript_10307:597-3401(-)
MTKAKKQASKGKPLLTVAFVQSIESKSSRGVDEAYGTSCGYETYDTFLITLTRRGLTSTEEKETMEALRRTQRCAALLVDRAAGESGLARDVAREICLYKPYQECVKTAAKKDFLAESKLVDLDPNTTADRILVGCIGSMDKLDNAAIEKLLQLSAVGDCGAKLQSFVDSLWKICRDERLRRTKPVLVSAVCSVGGPSSIAALVEKEKEKETGWNLAQAGEVSFIRDAISDVVAENQATGCSHLKVSVEGAGKYRLLTKCHADKQQDAKAYFEDAEERIKSLFEANVKGDCKLAPYVVATETQSSSRDASLQPTMNVGLIGDVANGKSTLIRAITGKRTQAHSSEQQKHGMTIKLGFANCSILRCRSDGCGKYCFRQDEVDISREGLQCAYCGEAAELDTRISFLDCPGHAELMATLLSGASAFDAVIFAAAANVPCPTPQARQHLEALGVTGGTSLKGRLIVAQTKSELVVHQAEKEGGLSAKEKLALHARNAKEKLSGTVAEGAPFIPVCSPMTLGLEPLAEWLANLPHRSPPSYGEGFKVLRSFDVNYAGADATKLAGGVLGGTINGAGGFRQGDIVELRPGIFLGTDGNDDDKNFRVQPLRFQIEEMRTDKAIIHEAKSGGLVAMQTTLCPSLCADDRLVGSVVGHPDTLPPVFGPKLLLDTLTFAKASPGSKVKPEKALKKKGTKVRCHSGSACVTGRVVRVSISRKKIELSLDHPICALRGSTMAIEVKLPEGHAFFLAGHATLVDGSVCQGGRGSGIDSRANKCGGDGGDNNNKDYHQSNKSVDECSIQERFLEDLTEKKNHDSGHEQIIIPSPAVQKDGGTHVLITNFAAIATALNRDPSHLQAYLAKEGRLACTRAGESCNSLRVKFRGRGFSELLRRMIRRYGIAFVTCHQCRSAKTELLKTSAHQKNVEMLCRQCCARRFIPD